MPDSVLVVFLIALSFVLASWVKGVVGMGLIMLARAPIKL